MNDRMVDRFKALDDGLERLRVLSGSVDFKTLITPTIVQNVSEVKFEKGTCKVQGVAKTEHYTVLDVTTAADSSMQSHTHPGQTEIIVVLEGDITIEFEDKKVVLGQYDTIVIHKGVPHKCTYILPGKTLAILVPTEASNG